MAGVAPIKASNFVIIRRHVNNTCPYLCVHNPVSERGVAARVLTLFDNDRRRIVTPLV